MERGDMEVEVLKTRFTVDEYERMAEVGIVRPEDRVELIDGEIIEMRPPGLRHISATLLLTTIFTEALGRLVMVSVLNPLLLDEHNMPQPDVIVLQPLPDFYASRRARVKDACLLIEISDSSLSFDRKVKVPHYAAERVPEVWIEDLKHDLLLVYREPSGHEYNTNLTLR